MGSHTTKAALLSAALAAAVTALAAPALMQSASAGTEGLASLHTWERIGGRTCMAGHNHYGQGSHASQSGAQVAAARDWSEFTALEYGPEWGDFRLAAAKHMKCGPARSGEWICNIEARPCRH